jgi:hypothetical protein
MDRRGSQLLGPRELRGPSNKSSRWRLNEETEQEGRGGQGQAWREPFDAALTAGQFLAECDLLNVDC